MRMQGAVIREQGITFAIAVVKPHVLDNTSQANDAICSYGGIFGPMPIVLMAQDSRGRPRYYGRPDIVKFLAGVPFGAIPWREYSVA